MKNAEKQLKKPTFSRWKRALSFALFLVLLGFVFCHATYLMRPPYTNRKIQTGIGSENVDVVYVGGSCAFTSWQPLKAWHDRGMTSYIYAHNSMFAEGVKHYLKEIRRTQDAKLYVIDARTFQLWNEQGDYKLRWGLDGMDVFSPNRWAIIREYWAARDTAEMDELSTYYFDIIKYHTMTENLADPESWALWDNAEPNTEKGAILRDEWAYMNPPEGYATEVRAQLHPNLRALLTDLLDYCRDEELNVQFVVPPYYITQAHQEMYNAIADIVGAYGYDFLNTNTEDCYREMGLDFSTDLYNDSHINLRGAEKYTAFFEDYIAQRYDLPDHSGDAAYAEWDEDYALYEEELTSGMETIQKSIRRAQKSADAAARMAATDDIYEWNAWGFNDSGLTLLFLQKGELDVTDAAQIKILNKWGLSPSTDGAVRVRSGGKEIFTNSGGGVQIL